MPNHLAGQTSPYLLQHVNNPVDWYPWGEAAHQRARTLERPIFLSIGYSACHWCHVMEHESFENPAIAALLNEHFVSIKVDREERPDLDQIYMQAVQALTGRGGWPMSVFLTPDHHPFFGGTYWPPTARQGMPGFDQVLAAVLDAWQARRAQVVQQSQVLSEQLRREGDLTGAASAPTAEALRAAAANLERVFDHVQGGFGTAPKFPHPIDLRLLLRCHARTPRDGLAQMVTKTLEHMAAGGIYDHLGGGFHRYSVDERWLVPHFEKMLYDNALLAGAYLEAFQFTGRADFARTAAQTLDFVLRDLTHPQGGFYSTLDADSEGEEGRFYVWRAEETAAVLGPAAARVFNYVYDVSEDGNFEGQNILNRPKTPAQNAAILGQEHAALETQLADARAKLLALRARRVWPARDEKILVAWNALMIDSLAMAGPVLGAPQYLAAAQRAADFLLTNLRRADGRLLHTWRDGVAQLDAYLDDHAYLGQALVTLYESDGNPRWIDEAAALAEVLLTQFHDAEQGGFYFTAHDHEALIARPKDAVDSSVPSGNGMAALFLARLGKLTGQARYAAAAQGTLALFHSLIDRAPSAAGQLLLAVDFVLGPVPELVLVGPAAEVESVLAAAAQTFLPRRVVARQATDHAAAASRQLADLLAGKAAPGGQLTLYVCENFTCQAPVIGHESVLAAIQQLAHRD